MYEYNVLTQGVKELEKTLDRHAQEGWRLDAVSPSMDMGMGVVVTLERKPEP